MLVEAELEGAIPILPLAALTPADDSSHPGTLSGGGLIGSMATVWDMDAYVALLHCFAGVTAVLPHDVSVPIKYGGKPSSSRVDSSALRKRVGKDRLLSKK